MTISIKDFCLPV